MNSTKILVLHALFSDVGALTLCGGLFPPSTWRFFIVQID